MKAQLELEYLKRDLEGLKKQVAEVKQDLKQIRAALIAQPSPDWYRNLSEEPVRK